MSPVVVVDPGETVARRYATSCGHRYTGTGMESTPNRIGMPFLMREMIFSRPKCLEGGSKLRSAQCRKRQGVDSLRGCPEFCVNGVN